MLRLFYVHCTKFEYKEQFSLYMSIDQQDEPRKKVDKIGNFKSSVLKWYYIELWYKDEQLPFKRVGS